VAYMDKLVGRLIAELERLKLREKTLLIFMGDNGTGHQWAKKGTIGGRELVGAKGEMTEGGAHVPLVANWPGVTPAGKVLDDMVDSTDFVPTFAELTGAKLPADKVLDGHSILPQLLGEKSTPRDHIFIELARNWYVREANWKLNEKGELYDMSDSPFTEKLVAPSADTEASKAARTRLTAALAKLNPAGGILDEGDGTGRHADKSKKEKKKMDKKAATNPDAAAAPKPEPSREAKPANVSTPSPLAPADAELAERARKFDRIDKEHKGKLTREEYMARQSDPEAASKRFDKFDVNRDGFVTREEYIANGAKKLKTPPR